MNCSLPRHLVRVSLLLLTALPVISQAQIQMGYNVGTWATSPVAGPAAPVAAGKVDETLREIVHVSVAGTQLEIVLSNEFGSDPLTIGSATVARSTGGSDIRKPVPLLFAGKPSVVIPPGALVHSDLARLDLPALSDLAVSLFLPAQPLTTITQHAFSNATNYIAPGDQTTAHKLTNAATTSAWRYLKGVQVNTAVDASILCLGDSITDGSKSTPNTNRRWTDLLAARLQASPATSSLGVLNEGIGGNRILHNVTGPSALARFDRDVLAQPHVRYLIILEGINDIGHAADPVRPYDIVSADDLIAGYKLLVNRAHAQGIKVYGATLTPYVGAKYASPAGEAMRSALNTWIRTTTDLDGVIDFDKASRDPANPTMFLPAYDSGDHLHPNDAGMKAMADSIDLKIFQKQP